MPKPLPPVVKKWRFGHPPIRPMRKEDHPRFIREKLIEDIVARQTAEKHDQLAEQGHGPSVQERVRREFPKIAGDEMLLEAARDKVTERLEAGAPNTWKTYEEALDKTMEDYNVRQDKPDLTPKTDEQKWQEGFEQIRAMRGGFSGLKSESQ